MLIITSIRTLRSSSLFQETRQTLTSFWLQCIWLDTSSPSTSGTSTPWPPPQGKQWQRPHFPGQRLRTPLSHHPVPQTPLLMEQAQKLSGSDWESPTSMSTFVQRNWLGTSSPSSIDPRKFKISHLISDNECNELGIKSQCRWDIQRTLRALAHRLYHGKSPTHSWTS